MKNIGSHIFQMLAGCSLRLLGYHLTTIDISKFKLTNIRPLKGGGYIVVLDPIDP